MPSAGKADGRPEKPVVLSWLAQVEWQEKSRPRSSFEVLVRHVFARLLSGASLDSSDDASVSWSAQVAYAAALPTMLFALYLFPAYHQPRGKPAFWAQVSHHFFYIDVSFAVMGLATVLIWDLLFPDTFDALILAPLPISIGRLLAARVFAVTLFLGGILLATSSLGIVFFPAVADLPIRFPWHFIVHACAVLASGLCAVTCVIALQGVAICCLSRRAEQALSPILQAICVLFFTMVLVLEPVLAHLLRVVLTSSSLMLHWFPPFWFLGLYEHLLAPTETSVAFVSLANYGLVATALMMLLALITYPPAFLKRTEQAIENASVANRTATPSLHTATFLARTLLQDGRSRAIFHWISQTLPRTRRTRLLLAFFAALILAAPLTVFLLRLEPGTDTDPSLLIQIGRLAIPAAAFLTIVGLRIALRAPVAQSGAWAFRVIYGRFEAAHSIARGTAAWVTAAGCIVSTLTALLIYQALPSVLHTRWNLLEQSLIGIILSILLTDVLFLRENSTPFTAPRVATVNDLSFAVVTYFVLFPVAAFTLAEVEPWAESTRTHSLVVILLAALLHWISQILKSDDSQNAGSDMEEDALLPGEVGLRNWNP